MINPESIAVTAAQIKQSNNPRENFKKIISVMDSVSSDVICFPELSLTGQEKLADLRPFHQAISEKAKQKGICVIYGAYENMHNMAYLVDDEGKSSGYAKVNLFEEPRVSPGDKPLVVDTKFGRFGVAIGFDMARDFPVRQYDRNVEVLFLPSYWVGEQFGSTEMAEAMATSLAFRNQSYVVFTNAAALSRREETCPKSRIVSPLGTRVTAQTDREAIITANISLKLLEMGRESGQW